MKTYQKNGKEHYLCQIRKKLILCTPEETVRQEFIQQLVNIYKVPFNFIETEVLLSNRKRADILVSKEFKEGRLETPLILIECKASNVPLTQKVYDQAEGYDNFLEPEFMIITNGIETEFYKWDEHIQERRQINELPTFPEIVNLPKLDYSYYEYPKWTRPNHLNPTQFEINELSYEIGEASNPRLYSLFYNLIGLFFDEEDSPKNLSFSDREFIEDLGVRYITFGNAGGGGWAGDYRSFLVQDKKETEIISLSIMGKTNDKKRGYTMLLVAIDNAETSNLSLQYAIDRFIEKDKEIYSFWHDGTLTAGNKGRLKNQVVIDYVKRKSPKLVKNNKIFLGKLGNSKPFKMG
ncbi:type I restriction enzyme HsdR N-terminal domain-containing protein [Aquimarina celericrescens]|uniref:Type I restriction enzyme HsdR N-terminal domain-containing protein n=1 Tax=Aquimarina celericrescens TaxID=1964542 RepID=A0ABW5ASR7_9FLAO|nr:type I restriction enzyme HsdR N-terminal domain-containing protein [Aquimarina celericrescens]